VLLSARSRIEYDFWLRMLNLSFAVRHLEVKTDEAVVVSHSLCEGSSGECVPGTRILAKADMVGKH
jgi:hypothetical protein